MSIQIWYNLKIKRKYNSEGILHILYSYREPSSCSQICEHVSGIWILTSARALYFSPCDFCALQGCTIVSIIIRKKARYSMVFLGTVLEEWKCMFLHIQSDYSSNTATALFPHKTVESGLLKTCYQTMKKTRQIRTCKVQLNRVLSHIASVGHSPDSKGRTERTVNL